jgi:hypothetical protein
MSDGFIGPPGPKKDAPQGWTAHAERLRKLRLLAAYHFLSVVQAPFGSVFWVIERRKGRIADRLTNLGVHL